MKNTASRAEKSSSRTITFCGRTGNFHLNFQNGRKVKKQTNKKLPATCGESCLS